MALSQHYLSTIWTIYQNAMQASQEIVHPSEGGMGISFPGIRPYIGCSTSGGSSPGGAFSGLMECLYLWRRCLTTDEITQVDANPYCMFPGSPTSKPAYGTFLDATNPISYKMLAAYLFNGADLNALINSVNGSDTLIYSGSGVVFDGPFDGGNGGVRFEGGHFETPDTLNSLFGNSDQGVAGLYFGASASAFIKLQSSIGPNKGPVTMGSEIIPAEYPYSDGLDYVTILSSSRFSFSPIVAQSAIHTITVTLRVTANEMA